MKLIMENWRKYLLEQSQEKIRKDFYNTDYDKFPLTDEEVEFILNPQSEEAAIARQDLDDHMEEKKVIPVQLLRAKEAYLGLRVKDGQDFGFGKLKNLVLKRR